MRNHNLIIVVFLYAVVSCCPVRNVQKEQIFIKKFESKIDERVNSQRIREGQGKARKEALYKDLEKFRAGEISCKELKKKEKYLTS